jgi:Cation transporting ATPase, C-terminus
MIFMQYGGLLSRNRRVSILNSNPLWGPRRNWAVPAGMLASALIGVANLYGPGLQVLFATTPIPSKFWGIPFGFALGILIMDETRKLIVRSYPKVCIFKKIVIILLLSGYFLLAFTYSQSSRRWLGSSKTLCSLENFSRLDKDKKGHVKEQICASRIE